MKRCQSCRRLLDSTYFDASTRTVDRLKVRCRECNESHRLAARKQYAEDPEARKAKSEYYKRRAEEPSFREARSDHERKRYAEDSEYKKAKSEDRMERYRNDPRIRVDNSFSSQIRQSLAGGKSGQSWEKLVGYTLDDLVLHLEQLFEDGMSWDNYGEWHIDHRKPKSWFNYETQDNPAFKVCWALSNLQPKWGSENMQKSNRYED